MSLDTSLRFQADKQDNAGFKSAFEAQVERIKYDEVMANRQNAARLHKYNDFWDTLVKDLDNVEKKAKGEEEEEEEDKPAETIVNQRAFWNENLEVGSWKKRLRIERGIINGEMRMASKAALAIRRVSLKQLLERELQMWEQELSLQGKTFYKQRV